MSYRKKSDSNQQKIINAIREYPGVSVRTIHRHGDGIPDLLVGFRGVTYLFEVKTETGQLEPKEKEFFDKWTGHVSIARCADDILEAIGYF